MKRLWLLLTVFIFFDSASAHTRNPVGAEHSLLYWRYLCENLPQHEKISSDPKSKTIREFSCPDLKIKIITHEDKMLKEEVVQEVIENDE